MSTGPVNEVRPRTLPGGLHAGANPAGDTSVQATPTPDRRAVDADLQKAARQAARMRQGFYLVVLLVALGGQVSGAVQALHIPLLWAAPSVAALELGGVVVLANADVRRRLGERAVGSRVLSAGIAAGAVAFNWTAHPEPLLGGFFAGMSALGYLVWLTHAENSRRDRLRAHGALPPTTPAYEPLGHWLRHPWLTRRARSLAKANPDLDLYESLDAARNELRAEQRRAAIATVLHRKIRAAVDPSTADIALAVYDLDEIANLLAEHADYHGLTALIAEDLAPSRLATTPTHSQQQRPPALPTRGATHETRERKPPTTSTPVDQRNAPHMNPPEPHIGACDTPPRFTPMTAPRAAAADGAIPSTTWTGTSAEHTAGAPQMPVPPDITNTDADPNALPTVVTGLESLRAAVNGGETAVHGEPSPPAGVARSWSAGSRPGTHADGGDPAAEGDASEESGSVPPTTAAAVAYWRRREPNMSLGEIAARISRSERTVYRHWHTDG